MLLSGGNCVGSIRPFAAVICFAFFAAGCGDSQSAEKRSEMAAKEFNIAPSNHVPFSGRVTVDGRAPDVPLGQSLLVILYDPKNPSDGGAIPKLMAVCKEDGSFQFPDGAEPGSYVVLFAELRRSIRHLRGKDGLKNLYNDPDKNKDRPEFNVELTPPGKTDYAVNLEVFGKDPVKTPGSHAIIGIGKE